MKNYCPCNSCKWKREGAVFTNDKCKKDARVSNAPGIENNQTAPKAFCQESALFE